MTQRRILAIHAHPDDESSKGAATMARYADEGNRVMVLTCTGGERGDILNPALIDTPGVKENIKAIRAEEMAAAVAALGVEHKWLGYIDSGLPQGDPLPPLPKGSFALADTDEVTQKVVQVIREFRPEVIITYDENGGYPHPDHLKVHEVSMLAWDLAGDPTYHPNSANRGSPSSCTTRTDSSANASNYSTTSSSKKASPAPTGIFCNGGKPTKVTSCCGSPPR